MKKSKDFKAEKEKRRLKVDKEIQRKLDLWERMEKGDMNALLTLSYERGLMTKEDLLWFKEIEEGKQRTGR